MQIHINTGAQAAELMGAILLYGNRSMATYASIHEVSQVGPSYFLNPGKPVSKSGLLEALHTLAPRKYQGPELIPDNLLSQGPNHMVWWTPPAPHQVWFMAEKIGERSGAVPLPGLVWFTGKSGWKVFAVKGDRRPTADTMLYQAPFYNVWAGGGICIGNVKTPTGRMAFQQEAWEEAFFRSYFTHPNIHAPRRLTLYRGGHVALWTKLLDGNLRSFPEASLVPLDYTLQKAFDDAYQAKPKGRR